MPKKKKVRKKAKFGPKPWVNPFGKMSIFRTFWTACFYSLERHFFVLEYRKNHFPNQYCLKKKMLEKRRYWDQNQGLTLLEKCKFFDLLELLVFTSLERRFINCRISIKVIFLTYSAEKKRLAKIAKFGPKPWVNPFKKMWIFRVFETSCFYSLERRFFLSIIS